MKHGEIEFQEQSEAILESISREGLRIAEGNKWGGLVIEMSSTHGGMRDSPPPVRCLLKSTGARPEVDEPSAALRDEADRLQELFANAGTPFKEATVDWIPGDTPGTVRRRCRFRYA